MAKSSILLISLVLFATVVSGFRVNKPNSKDAASCEGKCGSPFDRRLPCQCNSKCAAHHDCCADYEDKCGGGGDGGRVKDDELKQFSETLFGLQRPQALSTDNLQVNVQARTSQCGPDNAPGNLFTVRNEADVLAVPTIKKLLALFDNYVADVLEPEVVTDEEKEEEMEFMEAVMDTPEMLKAYQLLNGKKIFTGSYDDFTSKVHKMWFGLYDRDGTSKTVLDSCAFEHVFVGEVKRNRVSGQHNWIKQYLLEKDGRIDYRGYIDNVKFSDGGNSANVNILTSDYFWDSHEKCIGGGLIGTTPELEMALATVCFITRAGQDCNLSFGSKQFNYVTFPLTYQGYEYIGTAYPSTH